MVWYHGCHCTCLAYPLILETFIVKHIVKVHIASYVKLVCLVYLYTSIYKEIYQSFVSNCSSQLTHYVIASTSQILSCKCLLPFWCRSDKDGYCVYKGYTCIKTLFDIVLCGLSASHRKIVYEDLSSRVL